MLLNVILFLLFTACSYIVLEQPIIILSFVPSRKLFVKTCQRELRWNNISLEKTKPNLLAAHLTNETNSFSCRAGIQQGIKGLFT